MGRLFFHIALLAWGALALTGCGLADVRSPVPEFMRAKAADPAPPEPPPDIKGMLRDNVESVFTAASRAGRRRVERLRQGGIEFGDGQAAGHPDLSDNHQRRIVDRRRAGEEDTCASET